ncbi:MAG TPA: serine/threonine-protein kinase [Polyangiaceae bacterium]|nr:serine/threonine-protein kinase [Polyangiaceae bacterium]
MSSAPPSSPSMPFAPGTVLAGKYRVERLLGEGGMGWVVVATHLQLEQRVALKFMRASAAANSEGVVRFLREARAAARIQSEHVARVSDVGTLENGAPYLVMEYLEGQDLDALLQSRGALPVAMAIDYAMQACEGLAEAHAAGIVHRDLKPANLFLARRSDGSVRVKLLDFGISKLTPMAGGAQDVGMTSTQALMGSPLYMAPEQMRSSKSVDRRADLWSMGVILYEMLGGRSPFNAETLPEVCARIMTEPAPPLNELGGSVPAELEAVVMRCLEKEPARRFEDASALARALAPFGSAEAHSAAERITRLAGAVASAATQAAPALPRPAATVTSARSGAGAETSAAFGTVASAPAQRRSHAVAVAVGGVVLGLALGIGFAATRGGDHKGAAAPGAPSTAAPAPSPAASPSADPPSAPTPGASASPDATMTKATGEPPPARPVARPARPKAAPSVAKPAATSGFGGRD